MTFTFVGESWKRTNLCRFVNKTFGPVGQMYGRLFGHFEQFSAIWRGRGQTTSLYFKPLKRWSWLKVTKSAESETCIVHFLNFYWSERNLMRQWSSSIWIFWNHCHWENCVLKGHNCCINEEKKNLGGWIAVRCLWAISCKLWWLSCLNPAVLCQCKWLVNFFPRSKRLEKANFSVVFTLL